LTIERISLRSTRYFGGGAISHNTHAIIYINTN
jgi:hypothetical protein